MQILCFFLFFYSRAAVSVVFFHLAVLFRFYHVLFVCIMYFLSEQIKMMMTRRQGNAHSADYAWNSTDIYIYVGLGSNPKCGPRTRVGLVVSSATARNNVSVTRYVARRDEMAQLKLRPHNAIGTWLIMPSTAGNGAISVIFVRQSVAYIGNNSRTQKHSVSKFGMKVPHLRCNSHTRFKVKRSKVRVTDGRGIACRPNRRPHCLLLLVISPEIYRRDDLTNRACPGGAIGSVL